MFLRVEHSTIAVPKFPLRALRLVGQEIGAAFVALLDLDAYLDYVRDSFVTDTLKAHDAIVKPKLEMNL